VKPASASGAPLSSKFGNLLIQEILVFTSADARMSASTDSEGGRGESQDNPTGVENAIFFGGKSRGAFEQLAFFLAGNRM